MALTPEQEAKEIIQRSSRRIWHRLHDTTQPLEPGSDGSVKIPGWPDEFTPIVMDGDELLRQVSKNLDGSISDRTVRVRDGEIIYVNDKPKP